MRLTVALPTWGAPFRDVGLEPMVRLVEETALDGVWVGDHLVLSERDADTYPYRERFFLPSTEDWFEAVVCLTHVAGLTDSLELGLGIALAAVRPPVELAKQTATLTHLMGPDQPLVLGVGVGWMKAEYEAMGVPWDTRGRDLDSAVDLLRQCATGEPRPGNYGRYTIPPGTGTHPRPRRPVPILVGGNARPALRRAVVRGDGWIGALGSWDEEAADVAGQVRELHRLCEEEGRTLEDLELSVVMGVPYRITADPDGHRSFRRLLTSLHRIGISRVVLNLGWRDLGQTGRFLEAAARICRDAAGGARPVTT
jgi:alkanesulfonate monooxygenase SsuD/methylene tetrahydromethanopterin reductase-like flavin-dependent oxidoreductase (luciferase family)